MMDKAPRLIIALTSLVVLTSLAQNCRAQQEEPIALLDRLAGDWILSGKMGGKQTTHYIHAEWVLNREYLRLTEISALKKPNGQPKYEAVIFIEWDTKRREYACVWLDSTSGGGLSGPVAHAKYARTQPFSIPLVFSFSNTHTLRNTFTYDPGSDTWSSTISDVNDGKEDVFANVRLIRRRPPRANRRTTVEPRVTDDLRRELNVPSLAEAQARAAKMNQKP